MAQPHPTITFIPPVPAHEYKPLSYPVVLGHGVLEPLTKVTHAPVLTYTPPATPSELRELLETDISEGGLLVSELGTCKPHGSCTLQLNALDAHILINTTTGAAQCFEGMSGIEHRLGAPFNLHQLTSHVPSADVLYEKTPVGISPDAVYLAKAFGQKAEPIQKLFGRCGR